MDFKESDVEAAFCEWLSQQARYRVIGRQVPLPIGKLDILATHHTRGDGLCPVVVEVKRGRIDLEACGQLFGYLGQLETLLCHYSTIVETEQAIQWNYQNCIGILVGHSVDRLAMRVVKTMRVLFCRFTHENGVFCFKFDECNYFDEIDQPIDSRILSVIESVKTDRKERLVRSLQIPQWRFDDFRDNGLLYDIKDSVVYWKNPNGQAPARADKGTSV